MNVLNYLLRTGVPIPAITTKQMQEVDHIAVETYGIQILQMMENAGRHLAVLVRRLLGNSVLEKHIVVAVGKGNNGGGGMVAARHLANWGANILLLLPSESLFGISEIQQRIAKKLSIQIETGESAVQSLISWRGQLIIDALIGYGLSGNPRGWISKIITAANSRTVPIVALDVPSGLDATSGEIHTPCIHASATMTLALPKTGLLKTEAKPVIGSLYLADIGIPPALYEQIGIKVAPIFIEDTLILLDDYSKKVDS